MRTCLFCDRTDLSREHVWPEWVSRFLSGEPKHGRLTATATVGKAPVHSWPAPELNHKAKVVCSGCNHGWMSDVENACESVLKPMMLGQDVALATREQALLRGWFVLRAMILERAGAARNNRPFYTDDERRKFASVNDDGTHTPPNGLYVWLFQYRSSRWVARSNVTHLALHATPRMARLSIRDN